MNGYSLIQVMADSGRLGELNRELGWAHTQSCHDGQFGTPEAQARSTEKVRSLQARIRAARDYLRSDDYTAEVERLNDWIAS